MEEAAALRRLEPYRAEILGFTYRTIAAETRRHGAVPIWVFLPQVREGNWQEESPAMFAAAQATGFVLIDLSDVFKGKDASALRLAEWDEHPNASGHALVASRLFDALRDKRDVVFANARQ
jgi:hypothetical protein